jgi:large subunit ribosomal protein L39
MYRNMVVLQKAQSCGNILHNSYNKSGFIDMMRNRFVHQVSKQMTANIHNSNQGVREKRSQMFDDEKKRQLNLIPRIDKIEVQYEGQPENVLLYLNKNMSTPYNACQHMGEMLISRSALALVNGQLWDMHRPLEEDSTLKLIHFHDKDPFHLNRAFWRSCSFMLSAVLDLAFKEDTLVELHSFPAPNVASGSFVADVDLKCGHEWTPSTEELRVFSSLMHKLAEDDLKFERLVVSADLAKDMFQENQYKSKQIPSIADNFNDKITLYRVGDYVDISGGPMVGSTAFLGRRCTIPAAHKITHEGKPMYRFQGVALPKGVHLNHVAFSALEERASRINMAGLQTLSTAQPA